MTKLASRDNELLTQTADVVCLRGLSGDAPIGHLPPARFRFLSGFYTGQAIIDNGSLPYFFSSDFPDAPDYSLFSEAYRAIGAEDVVGYFDAAVALLHFRHLIWTLRHGSNTFRSIAPTARVRCASLAIISLRRVTECFHFWQTMSGSIQKIFRSHNERPRARGMARPGCTRKPSAPRRSGRVLASNTIQ